ncbi:hypothetical protein [Amycolatopsis sp.]|jgi:hypothetical protein|uniref:hypothetical protein n=1 Tax=Amycolatopsis sp. TaxID=37632 RepID=UPI002DFBBA6E|nr:hypothetical protein [Amycolatopsis sp.]
MRKRHGFVLVAGVLLALVTGCASNDGGDGKIASINSPEKSGEPGADPAADQGTDEDKMRAFAKCMREHGVDMPDPQAGPDGKGMIAVQGAEDGKNVDMAKMEAAHEACRKLLPNGGEMKPLDPAQLDKMRQDAKCMREHGIDMPDPEQGGKTTMKLDRAQVDEGKLEAAMKACGMGDGMRAVPAVPAK